LGAATTTTTTRAAAPDFFPACLEFRGDPRVSLLRRCATYNFNCALELITRLIKPRKNWRSRNEPIPLPSSTFPARTYPAAIVQEHREP
jgi:hypothetical protein